MKNIELKIKIDDFESVSDALKAMRAEHRGHLFQIDTYFNFLFGRLKLREINRSVFELIFYKRPDVSHSKVSRYFIIKLRRSYLNFVRFFLSFFLGKRVVVEKHRDLWTYKKTRVHLDTVSELGNFLELETVTDNPKKSQDEHKEVIHLLGISSHRGISNSYSNMLMSIRRKSVNKDSYRKIPAKIS